MSSSSESPLATAGCRCGNDGRRIDFKDRAASLLEGPSNWGRRGFDAPCRGVENPHVGCASGEGGSPSRTKADRFSRATVCCVGHRLTARALTTTPTGMAVASGASDGRLHGRHNPKREEASARAELGLFFYRRGPSSRVAVGFRSIRLPIYLRPQRAADVDRPEPNTLLGPRIWIIHHLHRIP